MHCAHTPLQRVEDGGLHDVVPGGKLVQTFLLHLGVILSSRIIVLLLREARAGEVRASLSALPSRHKEVITHVISSDSSRPTPWHELGKWQLQRVRSHTKQAHGGEPRTQCMASSFTKALMMPHPSMLERIPQADLQEGQE